MYSNESPTPSLTQELDKECSGKLQTPSISVVHQENSENIKTGKKIRSQFARCGQFFFSSKLTQHTKLTAPKLFNRYRAIELNRSIQTKSNLKTDQQSLLMIFINQ